MTSRILGVLLVLLGSLIGFSFWDQSRASASGAESRLLRSIDDYRRALARDLNPDLALAQIEAMKADEERLGILLPYVFANAEPLIEDAARRSEVEIRDYAEGSERNRDFHAERSTEVTGAGSYLAVARFVQALGEQRMSDCSRPRCEFPMHLVREATIEPSPMGDVLEFRIALHGYRSLEADESHNPPQVDSVTTDARPDEEAMRIISELKSQAGLALEPLPPIHWPQPGPARTYPEDPFRLGQP